MSRPLDTRRRHVWNGTDQCQSCGLRRVHSSKRGGSSYFYDRDGVRVPSAPGCKGPAVVRVRVDSSQDYRRSRRGLTLRDAARRYHFAASIHPDTHQRIKDHADLCGVSHGLLLDYLLLRADDFAGQMDHAGLIVTLRAVGYIE